MRWAKTGQDYAAANAVINHPDVLPYHAPPGWEVPRRVDMTGWPVLLEEGKACWLFSVTGATWEVHTSVLPDWRHESLKMAKQLIDKVFNETDCLVLSSYAPHNNKPAIRLATAAGLQITGQDDKYIYFALTREQWDQTN